MPDSLPHAEDASLYVLDLLDAEARRSFESELEASPELQRHVADLQVNLEALALTTPPVLPPASVWNGIARRLASEPAVPAHAAAQAVPDRLTLWAWLRHCLSSGWAMAALVALAFVGHLLWNGRGNIPPPGELAAEDVPPAPRSSGGPDSRATRPGRSTSIADASRSSGTAGGGSRSPSAAAAGSDEAARLQDRVRLLSEQVAMLTHVLAQRAVLPAGSAQLQVFRLVTSNGLSDPSEAVIADLRRTGQAPGPGTGLAGTNPQTSETGTTGTSGTGTTGTTSLASATQELPLALALAAARQFASLTPSPSTDGAGASSVTDHSGIATRNNVQAPPSGFTAPPTADGTAIPVESSGAAHTIQVVDLTSTAGVGPTTPPAQPAQEPTIVSSSDATAFGAFSAETGQGAIAFRVWNGPSAADAPAEVYQLWMNDPHTGLVQSVGYTAIGQNPGGAAQVVVLRFNADAGAFTNPSFMITREPAGGSSFPTGPIVAQPPASTVVQPTP